jgi:hypothetical protein
MEWIQVEITSRGMNLNKLSIIYRQSLQRAYRQDAQDHLIEELDDTVTAIQQNADPPGTALRMALDQTRAAIQQNPDDPNAQGALVDLTQTVVDTLGGLGPDAPILPEGLR